MFRSDVVCVNKNKLQAIRENKMKKQYTKKQISEAIAYWKKQLRMMNEDFDNPQQNEPEWTKQFRNIGNKSLTHCSTPDSIAQEIKRFDRIYPIKQTP